MSGKESVERIHWDKVRTGDVCSCGAKLKNEWLEKPFVLDDSPSGFMGNAVSGRMLLVCQKCNMILHALLKGESNTYKIIGSVASSDERKKVANELADMNRNEILREASKRGVKGSFGSLKTDLIIKEILNTIE